MRRLPKWRQCQEAGFAADAYHCELIRLSVVLIVFMSLPQLHEGVQLRVHQQHSTKAQVTN
jgi:hypothetical protein